MDTRLPRHKWPKSWADIEDLVVLFERNLNGHLWKECFWKDNSKKLFQNLDGRKYRFGNVCLFIEKQGLFLSAKVDDLNLLENRKWLPSGRN